MPRLMPGEDPKIDKINDLVLKARDIDNKECSNLAIETLLQTFKPMILNVCKKWSDYFNDEKHHMIPFDNLVMDAQYWFVYYTQHVYTVDGKATYNKFIKDHIDQRIRYIYETELKYFSRNIFPDPNKNTDVETSDPLESVIHQYSSSIINTDIESNYINDKINDGRVELAHYILSLLNSPSFNERERTIFTEIVYNGSTHENIGSSLKVSRTRVTQILNKTKAKLYKMMENNQKIWDLIDCGDINIKEGKF